MTPQTIAKTLKNIDWINIDFDKNVKSRIRNAKNTRISSFIEFLNEIQYKLLLNGKQYSTIDAIREYLRSNESTTLTNSIHQTQFNEFVAKKKDIDTTTLFDWCDKLGIVPTLEKS